MIVQTVGVNLPADFPAATYNAAHLKVAPLQPMFPEAYLQYGSAWNAVAYRFYGCARADQSFRASLKTKSPLGRLREERALFDFFASAYATLDSLAYAVYGIAHMLKPSSFELSKSALRGVSPGTLSGRLAKFFPLEPIVPMLASLLAEPTLAELHELRNVLSHRTASTRAVSLHVGSGSPDPDVWVLGHLHLASGLSEIAIGPETTAKYRGWLAAQLMSLLPTVKHLAEGLSPST